MLSDSDWQALWLTVRLAGAVTLILLLLGTPLAWWLARSRSRWKAPIGAVVALPLVLPPSVLGFYLLLAMGPDGPLGQLTEALGLPTLPFTFTGLVVASVFYSLPFMVQPLQNAFEAMGERPMEVAATLRASPLDAFLHGRSTAGRARFPDRVHPDFCAHGGRVWRGADDRGQPAGHQPRRLGADLRPCRVAGLRSSPPPRRGDAGVLVRGLAESVCLARPTRPETLR
jgi:hypothetical protein